MILKMLFIFAIYFFVITADAIGSSTDGGTKNSSSLYDRGPVLFPKSPSETPPTPSNGTTKSSIYDRGPVVFPKVVPGDTNTPSNTCNETLTCGENEVLDKCPSKCPSDSCPTAEGQNKKCPKPRPCPPPACKCGFNMRKNINDTCIPTRECPPFNCTRPNEVYHPCPPLCPTDSCSQATPTGECPRLFGNILIVLECQPACRCKPKFWRNENGTCIPYNECTEVKEIDES